jgi:hypothetical protein
MRLHRPGGIVCGFILLSSVVLASCRPVDTLLGFLGFGQAGMKDEIEVDEHGADREKHLQELAKANSELLGEMVRVVFNQEKVEDQVDFAGLVQSLNQGASLEGVYRGLVMGARYRGLESKSQGASPAEVKVFAVEMSELQMIMRNPTRFTMDSKKVPEIEYPDEEGGSFRPSASSGAEEVEVKREKGAIQQDLIRKFVGASLFTLKRTLGEEALRKFDESKEDPAGIAQWYAALAVRLVQQGVDGGLQLRNSADFRLHSEFAGRMSQDRVRWEVLNRYHRYLNDVANRMH